MVTERPRLTNVPAVLAARVRAHRSVAPKEEERAEAAIRARADDLLDSWFKVAERQQQSGARLVYQRYENADGPALLHDPLDPLLASLDPDYRRFTAGRSMRDVEHAAILKIADPYGQPLT